MVRLGIDYGTTNTVAVLCDRGIYPVVRHTTDSAIGPISREVFPSIAVRDREDGSFHFGAEAMRHVARPGAEERYDVLRSLKRLIRDYSENITLGHDRFPGGVNPETVLRDFLIALRASILRSGFPIDDETLETVITWPANANGAQRYLTRRCFREAGFDVIGSLTEPAAAAIEFADRISQGSRARARKLSMKFCVIDIGGGTLDVSLMKMEGRDFTVIDCTGIEELGGDDLDELLARLFAEQLGKDIDTLPLFQKDLLLNHARQQKESISSGSIKTMTLVAEDLGLGKGLVSVPVDLFYKESAKLLGPAVEKVWDLLHGDAAKEAGVNSRSLDAIYLAGGTSRLTLVSDLVSRRFPRTRIVSSDKPFSATAMGAAIHSQETVRMQEILSRHFGVMRLSDHGSKEYFDPIFAAGTQLPHRGNDALEKKMVYTPRHNIGHLRYLECAAINDSRLPTDGIRAWSEAFFPYDPLLDVHETFSANRIEHRDDLHELWVDETYTCDADGIISVHIKRHCDGHSKTFEIFKD